MRANTLNCIFSLSVSSFGTPHAVIVFSYYKTTTNLPMITKSILPLSFLALGTGSLLADDAETKAGYDELVAGQGDYAYAFDFFTTSMLWTCIAAALVFLMHLGFASLEAGLTQKKEHGKHPVQKLLHHRNRYRHLLPCRLQYSLPRRFQWLV